MEIDKKLHDEIREYCKYNHLKIGEYIDGLLRKAFNEDRYGTMPLPLMEKIKKETEKDIYPLNEIREDEEASIKEKIVNEPKKIVETVTKAENEEIKEKPKKVIRKLK